MYLICQVRYLPLRNEILQENDFSYWKNNFPIKYFDFPTGIKELPIGIKFR